MPTDTANIRALAAAATPGPWHDNGLTLRPGTVHDSMDNVVCRAWENRDAAYIAALSPQTVTALLDVVDAAKTASGSNPFYGGGIDAHRNLRDALDAWEALPRFLPWRWRPY
jgi:hypothetical protein